MLKASLQALFVTFLWSTSWVLIKEGLGDIPPITFAGLRYFLAFLLLLPLLARATFREELKKIERPDWKLLLLLGVVYYTLTQGALFLGLLYLPANTLSLMLTFSGIGIALIGRIFLDEKVNQLQWMGVFVSVSGAVLYFGEIQDISYIGIGVGLFIILSNSFGSILGRKINREERISPAMVTIISMGAGSILLLATGLLAEDFPVLAARDWIIIFWLAAVNTSFAFTLWNRSLQKLSATQSGVINNTMLIQIAILAWIFLGEQLGGLQIVGLIVAVLGTLMVQLGAKRKVSP